MKKKNVSLMFFKQHLMFCLSIITPEISILNFNYYRSNSSDSNIRSNFVSCSCLYAGTVKRHNVYANVTFPLTLVSSKLNQHFSPYYFNGIKIGTAFKCLFEETVPKLSIWKSRTNIPSHDPCLEFRFTEPQYSDKC